MKKSILTLAVWLMAAMTVMADQLTQQQAEEAAMAFLSKQNKPTANRQLKLAQHRLLAPAATQQGTAYYVFNIGQEQGYVVVSGDDHTQPILGYVDEGSFNHEELPPHVKAWFDGYADQLDYLARTGGKNERPRLKVERNAVKPLLKSIWNQGSPYNNMCPIDPTTSEQSVTGCVATALAQVLNYFKYPAQTIAPIPAYTTDSRSISMPEIPVTTIDWDNMLNSYEGTTTTAQQNAVAQLMLLCGQGVGMDYTSGTSGAQSTVLVNALQNYFGYDRTTRILSRNSYSADEWDDLLYSEMAAGRPVLFSGLSAGGGHQFVIDGYKSDGLFHVNWGWGGTSDGYFLISVLNPKNTSGIGASSTSDGYSFYQDAVVGIQHGTNEIAPELLTVYSLNASTTSYTRSASNENFADIDITSKFYNMTGVTANGMMMALVLLDSDGNWATENVLTYVNSGTLGNFWGANYTFTCSFGAGLPDGTYHIVPFSASEGSETWKPAFGANVYNIKAVISGNKLTLTNPTVSLNAAIQAEGKTEAGHKLQLKASITNQGTYFNNTIYLYVNGEMKGGRNFEAREGETRDFEIDFTPTATGSNTVSLAYKADGGLVAFATTKINIDEAASGRHLTATVSFPNTVVGLATASTIQVQVDVTNDGEADYDNQVEVSIWKNNASDGYYYRTTSTTQDLTLAAGQSTTISTEFDNLIDRANYFVCLRYVNEGNSVEASRAYFSTDFSMDDMTVENFEDTTTFPEFSLGGITNEHPTGSLGEWKLYDGNSIGVYTINGVNVPNLGCSMAWMVFAPGSSQLSQNLSNTYPPHSGNQFMASFCIDGETDHWLISPALSGNAQTIRFYVRALTSQYGAESFEVLYSTTGTDINDFTLLKSESTEATSWTSVNYDLPEGATYFAIRHTSNNVFALFVDDIFYEAEESSEASQTLELAQGWNWVSSYLQEPMELSKLTDHSSRILSQEQELIRDPQYGMVGSLTALEAGKGYKVQAMSAFSCVFNGLLFDTESTPIQLQKGWNWIAYPLPISVSLTKAIGNAEEGDAIVGQTGFSEYSDGKWEGTLSALTPGAGYIYKSANTKQLAFASASASRNDGALKSPQTALLEPDEALPAMHRYPNTMNIVARICQAQSYLEGSRYRIKAMAGDELRGISLFVGKNHYLTVYGEQPDPLTFIVEDTATGTMLTSDETLTFSDGLVGSRSAPFDVHIGVTTGITSIASPTTTTTISTLDGIVVSRSLSDIRRLPKGLYIVNGRKFHVK